MTSRSRLSIQIYLPVKDSIPEIPEMESECIMNYKCKLITAKSWLFVHRIIINSVVSTSANP